MIHLIIGVAGGIMLAVYAITAIERWREKRRETRIAARKAELLSQLPPPPPRQPTPNPVVQPTPADLAAWKYWTAPLGTPAHLLPPRPL